MIPILMTKSMVEDRLPAPKGIRLSDAADCIVIEERNSIYELEMKYPVTGLYFSEIQEGKFLLATPNANATTSSQYQVFRIYKISKPLNNLVTIYAEHISYLLNKMVALPFNADTCQAAFAKLPAHITNNTQDFTFWTDIAGDGYLPNGESVESDVTFGFDVPMSTRDVLGGGEKSIQGLFGGDFEFDNYQVKLYKDRGSDKGVVIRYGKNLTDLTDEKDIQNAYTGIVPYFNNSTSGTIIIDSPNEIMWSTHRGDYEYDLVVPVDLTDKFEKEEEEAKAAYDEDKAGWNNHKKDLQVEKEDYNLQKSRLKEQISEIKRQKYEGWEEDVAELEAEVADLEALIEPIDEELEYMQNYDYPEFEFPCMQDPPPTFPYPTPHVGNYLVTVAEIKTLLIQKANEYFDYAYGWVPDQTITLSFVPLYQSEEYKTTASLDRVSMCDTVTVIYENFGIDVKKKVVAYKYDVLKERYNELTLGDAKSSELAKAVADLNRDFEKATRELAVESAQRDSELKIAIDHATKMITGGLGGNVRLIRDANGNPVEILIMDTDDPQTCVNVWRWNLGGLAHSHNGYMGPFDDVALTADGQISATYITTGLMSANRVRTGVLQSNDGKLVFDLDKKILGVEGEFRLNSDNLRISSDEGLSVISSNITTKINHGSLKVYKGDEYMGELGRVDFYNSRTNRTETTLAIKMGGTVSGDTPHLNSTKGIMLSVGDTAYYMLNPDHRSLDYTTYGYEHWFKGYTFVEKRYKTSNGYGFGAGVDVPENPHPSYWTDTGGGFYVNEDFKVRYGAIVGGNLEVGGDKARVVHTERYGQTLMHAFETASPMFTDIGSATISPNGKCYVSLEDQFIDVCEDSNYYVQLQGVGSQVYLDEKTDSYFIVSGEPGTKFDWMIIMPQKGYADVRFGPADMHNSPQVDINVEGIDQPDVLDPLLNSFEYTDADSLLDEILV